MWTFYLIPVVSSFFFFLAYSQLSQTCRQSEKKLLNSNISSKCPYSIVNFGPLMAEIGLPVWDTPANFNGFHILALLLHRCRWMEANQTLHDVWRSPGLVHCIYIFGSSCPLMEFCRVQNSLCIQILCAPILAPLLHDTWPLGVSQTLRHGIFTRQGGHPVGHWPVELSSSSCWDIFSVRSSFMLWVNFWQWISDTSRLITLLCVCVSL